MKKNTTMAKYRKNKTEHYVIGLTQFMKHSSPPVRIGFEIYHRLSSCIGFLLFTGQISV